VVIAIGVILKYTLPVSLAGARLEVIGIILMVVGALGLVLSLLIWGPRPRSVDRDLEIVEPGRGDGRFRRTVGRWRD
jgi:hypothetical protein